MFGKIKFGKAKFGKNVPYPQAIGYYGFSTSLDSSDQRPQPIDFRVQ